MTIRTILHVGPGHRNNGARLPEPLATPEWREIRLDIDPSNEPDIVGSMLDMPAVADASVDAVYSAHNIEHVYPHEVGRVLQEFLRVLKPGGFLLVTCPDLQTVGALIAEDKLTDPAYMSPAGPITPLDILYGHRQALAQGNHYMAHRCGFTLKVLFATLQVNGFQGVLGKRRPAAFDLWALATRGPMTDDALQALGALYLPA
ncbi:class I SAM-dependent methyltransferase [Oxalobacteraceae bacterium OM1]|nr:class I SAM-dependent methyltransferase [Oxalobacteraceae bacterium OM1]